MSRQKDNLVIEDAPSYREIARDMWDDFDDISRTAPPWMAMGSLYTMVVAVAVVKGYSEIWFWPSLAMCLMSWYYVVKYWGEYSE